MKIRQGHLTITRILNRRRYFLRFLLRTILCVFVIAAVSYLAIVGVWIDDDETNSPDRFHHHHDDENHGAGDWNLDFDSQTPIDREEFDEWTRRASEIREYDRSRTLLRSERTELVSPILQSSARFGIDRSESSWKRSTGDRAMESTIRAGEMDRNRTATKSAVDSSIHSKSADRSDRMESSTSIAASSSRSIDQHRLLRSMESNERHPDSSTVAIDSSDFATPTDESSKLISESGKSIDRPPETINDTSVDESLNSVEILSNRSESINISTSTSTNGSIDGPNRRRLSIADRITDADRRFVSTLVALTNLSLCPELPIGNASMLSLASYWSSIINRTNTDDHFDEGISANEFNSTTATNSSIDISDESNGDQDPSSTSSSSTTRAGGWWQPIGCQARHTTAVIVPFRDRDRHLRLLLPRLHQLLRYQWTAYRIVIVEQSDAGLFNKGALFNAAFQYLLRYDALFAHECLIFHDVDLIPEDERNSYTCPPDDDERPMARHMSPAVDTLQYHLPYPELVGGVLAMSPRTYLRLNGYSNLYGGWGGEDDDMHERLVAEKINLLRPPQSIGRYRMMTHAGRPAARNRWQLIRTARRRYKRDGVAQSIEGRTFNIVRVIRASEHTRLVVELPSVPVMAAMMARSGGGGGGGGGQAYFVSNGANAGCVADWRTILIMIFVLFVVAYGLLDDRTDP